MITFEIESSLNNVRCKYDPWDHYDDRMKFVLDLDNGAKLDLPVRWPEISRDDHHGRINLYELEGRIHVIVNFLDTEKKQEKKPVKELHHGIVELQKGRRK